MWVAELQACGSFMRYINSAWPVRMPVDVDTKVKIELTLKHSNQSVAETLKHPRMSFLLEGMLISRYFRVFPCCLKGPDLGQTLRGH